MIKARSDEDPISNLQFIDLYPILHAMTKAPILSERDLSDSLVESLSLDLSDLKLKSSGLPGSIASSKSSRSPWASYHTPNQSAIEDDNDEDKNKDEPP